MPLGKTWPHVNNLAVSTQVLEEQVKTARRLTVLAVLCSLIVFSITASAANPKTTGDADWINPYSGGTQANTTFNAIAIHPTGSDLSLIHISEPTRLGMISYAVFC